GARVGPTFPKGTREGHVLLGPFTDAVLRPSAAAGGECVPYSQTEEQAMNPVTESTALEASAPQTSAGVQGLPRLWPGVLFVLLFWSGFFIMGAIEKHYFFQFIYNMAAPAVLLLFFSIWWWRNRRIPFADRVYGCLLVVGM